MGSTDWQSRRILGQYFCLLCRSIIGYRPQGSGNFVLINHFIPAHGYTREQVNDFDALMVQPDDNNPGYDQIIYNEMGNRVAEMAVFWRQKSSDLEVDKLE